MIAEAMPQLVWTARADGTIEYLNQRWIEYTGVDLDEFTRRGDDIGAVHPDDLVETWRLWRAAVESGRPYEHEYRLQRASDGSFRWFLARGVPIRSDDGKIVRWIGTATDIDEHHRAGERLRFSSRVNQLLLETTDPWQAMERIAQMVASEIADACAILRLVGRRGEMGCDDEVRRRQQRPLVGLLAEDIERGACERAGDERVEQRCFVDEFAACGVDQTGAGLHLRE